MPEPHINPQFPVQSSDNLSPPIVQPPIHPCAQAVYVYGFVPGATVRVYANGAELVGHDEPVVGFATLKLTRELAVNEAITATQTVGSVTSAPSYEPVVVSPYPQLRRPVVGPDLYDCGRVVPVFNLTPSTYVEVRDFDTGEVLGGGETTGEWVATVTSPLHEGQRVSAMQIACKNTEHLASGLSKPVIVQAQPRPSLRRPVVDRPVIGTNVVTLHELYVGAEIRIEQGAPIGGGLASARDNWVYVNPPVASGSTVDATQKLCTSSGTRRVVPISRITALQLGAPICEGSRYVTIDGTVLNANVVLMRGGRIIGYGGGVLGTLRLAIGGGVTLHAGDVLTAQQYIGTITSPPSNSVRVGCAGGENVTTQHNDNYRTGCYLQETTLTPSAIRTRGMGVLYTHGVDGDIHAQPLFVRNVDFRAARANGLFLTTTANMVYALDAETGAQQWAVTLRDSHPEQRGLGRPLSSSTPVIDVTTNRMFVLFSTKNQRQDTSGDRPSEDALRDLDVAYWLVALDCRDGRELARTQVAASLWRFDGTELHFTAKNQMDRPALLLDHGSVYAAFGMRPQEEFVDYHGWVLRFRASDLALTGTFCTSRNATSPSTVDQKAEGAGIWQGGGGLAADADGNVYFLVGNGTADIATDSFGDMFVKVTPTPTSLVASAFVPAGVEHLRLLDLDLGSGGAMTFLGFNLVVGGGKTGYMYLLHRDSMRLEQQITAATNNRDGMREQGWDVGPHLHGSPTYWRGPDPTYGCFYVWGEKDYLRLFHFDTRTQRFIEPEFQRGAVLALQRPVMPGGILSISAHDNRAGTGVLWATLPTAHLPGPESHGRPGRLYAFHAETLEPLWDAPLPSLGKWNQPTIADGKVFMGTSSNRLIVYRLNRPGEDPPPQDYRPFQPHLDHMLPPLSERYPDKQSFEAHAAIALNQTAPPPGLTRVAVLEGDGIEAYEAVANPHTKAGLAWQSTGATAQLIAVAGRDADPPPQPLTVELSPGPVWLASDGSRASGQLISSVRAPEPRSVPWEVYAATSPRRGGLFATVIWVRRIFTFGGAAPAEPPKGESDKQGVAFHAQYALYEKARD